MLQEKVGRILVSLGLLALIGFCIATALGAEAAEKLGCTNVASLMVGAPRRTAQARVRGPTGKHAKVKSMHRSFRLGLTLGKGSDPR